MNAVWRLSLLSMCVSAPLCLAQLATTDDGGLVLLASRWRLSGEAFEPLHYGIYGLAANRWSQAAHANSGYSLARPFLSGDGSVSAWDRIDSCSTGSCSFFSFGPRSATEFQGLAATVKTPTFGLIPSRHTRFLLSPGFYGLSDFALQDLTTGQIWSPPAVPYLRTFGVADDGAVIGLAATHNGNTIPLTPNRVVVWRPGNEAIEIFQAPSVANAWISADASRAMVEVAGADTQSPHELWWIDIASGTREQIAQQAPGGCVNFIEQVNHQISNDGSRVLFFWPCAASTLWFWEPGREARPAAHADEGFLSAVLSGDGRVAWALAASGRLSRIPVDGGPIEEALSALPPYLNSGYAGSVPGSAMAFTQPGGITPGLRFTAGGFDFPVIDDSTHDSVAVQIPWDYAEPPSTLIVTRRGHPFELAMPVSIDPTVRPKAAGELRNGSLWIKAAQQDFSALVTEDNPAPAGSTIHAWFYNLGPARPARPDRNAGPERSRCSTTGADGLLPADRPRRTGSRPRDPVSGVWLRPGRHLSSRPDNPNRLASGSVPAGLRFGREERRQRDGACGSALTTFRCKNRFGKSAPLLFECVGRGRRGRSTIEEGPESPESRLWRNYAFPFCWT